jgi:lysophospholipase L1-like esterase
MLSALTRRLAAWFRGSGRARQSPASIRDAGRRRPLTVEALEDRCLPSVNPVDVAVPLGDVLMALMPKTNPSVVFLGDSITYNYAYGGGAGAWNAYMAPLGAANYGVGGQTTQSLLYQLGLGQLVGTHPSLVVLMIGTNDLVEGTPPLMVAAGIVADVNAIHFYLPDTKVLVLGTPPGAANPGDPFRVAVNQTDAILGTLLAGDPHAIYLNVAPAFESADGTIPPRVMSDGFHPTDLGFLYLTSLIYPTVHQAVLAGAPVPLSAANLPPLSQV